MSRGRACGAALVALVVMAGAASAATPKAARYLDKATSCQRAGKSECVLEQANKALAWLATDAGKALPNVKRLRREALVFRAEALALLGRPETAAAFDALLTEAPDYRPQSPPDAVAKAFAAAVQRRIKTRLPTTVSPGELPRPPGPRANELLPDPVIYATRRLLDLDPKKDTRKAFRLSLGVGGAIIAGDPADFFDQGLAAVFEFVYKPDDDWRVMLQLNMSLHSLAEGVRADGFSGLTTVAVTIGGGYDLNIIDDFDMVFALGIGGGFFGAREATDEVGIAGQAVVGLRYWISPSLALRADATPQLIIPIGGRVDVAAHVNVFVRAEAKF